MSALAAFTGQAVHTHHIAWQGSGKGAEVQTGKICGGNDIQPQGVWVEPEGAEYTRGCNSEP